MAPEQSHNPSNSEAIPVKSDAKYSMRGYNSGVLDIKRATKLESILTSP